MRHLKAGKKFHRLQGDRRQFIRNLAANLIRHGTVETTEVRAKAIRPVVEKMVTMAKKNTLAARRLLIARLQSVPLVHKLMADIAPRYTTRPGGYLRITKLAATRKRDGTRMARIEFV